MEWSTIGHVKTHYFNGHVQEQTAELPEGIFYPTCSTYRRFTNIWTIKWWYMLVNIPWSNIGMESFIEFRQFRFQNHGQLLKLDLIFKGCLHMQIHTKPVRNNASVQRGTSMFLELFIMLDFWGVYPEMG